MTNLNTIYQPKPVILTGRFVSLEPLSLEHAVQLSEAAQSEEIWHHTLDKPRTLELMTAYIERALTEQAKGTSLPFAVRHLQDNRIIGSTRYWEITPWRRGLQIGFTWFDPKYWGTNVNTESKYLLLKQAFEELGTVRVEIQTSTQNTRAQKAILKLGAVEEGVLRARIVRPDGTRLDCIFYSILDNEWDSVKQSLEARLN
jgi:RimJ/RimL family protein N-acetyltransferase